MTEQDNEDSFEDEFNFLDEEEFENSDDSYADENATTTAKGSTSPEELSAMEATPATSPVANILDKVNNLIANQPKAKFKVITMVATLGMLGSIAIKSLTQSPTVITEEPQTAASNTIAVGLEEGNLENKDKATTDEVIALRTDDIVVGSELGLAAEPNKTPTTEHQLKEKTNEENKSKEEISKLFTEIDLKPNALDTQAIINETKEPSIKGEGDIVVGQRSLNELSQDVDQSFNQIQQLQATLAEVSRTLSNVNQNINDMDTKVLGLTENVNTLSNDINGVKRTIAEEDLDLTSHTKATASRPTLSYKAPEYTVHAIIPGRAWLKSASGHIITIAEGDSVGDYGTIAVIDAANNIVRTSSGVTFR